MLEFKGVRGTLRLMLRETFSHAFLLATTPAFQCHLPSHRSLDLAAVSRSHGQRTRLSFCDSRSRHDLLPRTGSGGESHGSENPQNSVPIAPGELPLRTPSRNTTSELSRFCDSNPGSPSKASVERLE